MSICFLGCVVLQRLPSNLFGSKHATRAPGIVAGSMHSQELLRRYAAPLPLTLSVDALAVYLSVSVSVRQDHVLLGGEGRSLHRSALGDRSGDSPQYLSRRVQQGRGAIMCAGCVGLAILSVCVLSVRELLHLSVFAADGSIRAHTACRITVQNIIYTLNVIF